MSGLGAATDRAGLVVPYVATWSGEEWVDHPLVVERGAGIAYADEIVGDRDGDGVLWDRVTGRPGQGTPLFAKIHPLRQRRAMRRLLCQICGSPADNTCHGVLWLLRDTGAPSSPEMLVSEPPICLPCARLSVRVCPALRKGHILLRAGSFTLYGVDGILYRTARPSPVPVDHHAVAFGDPAIRWTLAAKLVRELGDCTVLNL
ncbi:hypothetical protein [Actinokineospora iranica]|uniref:Uncharacterized protein n=1 Tax=Actinokineospora iranica TaxID=1271860 RepID=A0A1G6U912_9PSEU|nr:hypothetical protein [Actinokineospora iranica]SDD37196.1 hypothetical protein SAMN05216174_110143 [Actinokineospora iranica]